MTNLHLKIERGRKARAYSKLIRTRGANRMAWKRVLVIFFLCGTAFAQQQPPASIPTPPVLQKYPPVTAERLTKPEDSNWLMIRRTYDGWGYSPLDQITPAN